MAAVKIVAAIVWCLSFEIHHVVAPATLATLQTALNALPQPLVYYQMSMKFSMNDASGRAIDGSYSPGRWGTATGPFSVADTATVLGPTVGDDNYVIIQSPKVNLAGYSSWSMSMWVNMNGNVGPMLEYDVSPLVYGAHLWQYNSPGTLDGNTNSIEHAFMACSMTSWQYVGWVYDNSTKGLRVFCGSSFSASVVTTVPPVTSDTLLVGMRRVGAPTSVDSAAACLAIYTTTLSAAQLNQVKALCQMYDEAITCSANCAFDTCRVNMSMPAGYICSSCNPGWMSLDCNTFTCDSPCLNGGTCSGPNTCTCTAQWHGLDCSLPTCSPLCAHGGSCIAPNNCTCTTGWTGSSCNTPFCSPSCQNGGVCSSPNVCTCLAGWIGSFCTVPICVVPCTPYECIGPNTCSQSIGKSNCNPVKGDFSWTSCNAWHSQGHCLSNPSFMWDACQTSCTSYSTCQCLGTLPAVSDDLCGCGDWATAGLCEIDWAVANTNCTFTCNRRLNSTYHCTTQPVGISLPANAVWKFTAKGSSDFTGWAAPYLQSATMTCQPGFAPDDPTFTGMFVCDPFTPNSTSGNWFMVNPNTPTCIRTACSDPPDVSNGVYVNYTSASNYFYGDKVRYSCNTGYIMTGATVPEAICALSASAQWAWTDLAVECILPPCQPLEDGINAIYNISANHTGGVANYNCLKGFYPIVSKTLMIRFCQSDGSWLPVGRFECAIVVCPDPKPEPNSYLTGTKSTTYYYADAVTTQCSKGSVSMFMEPGSETTPLQKVVNTCTDGGDWSTNKIACLPVQCPTPQPYEIAMYRIMNTSSEITTLVYDMILAFECDWNQGYESADNQSSGIAYWHCNENSTWEKQQLKCAQSGLLKSLGARPLRSVSYDSNAAVVTGTTVMAMLTFFLGIIFCLDYLTVNRDIRRLRKNFGHFLKRFRDRRRIRELHELRQVLRHKVVREQKLKEIADDEEVQKMNAAGFTGIEEHDPVTGPVLIANPFSRDGSSPRLSASNGGHSDPQQPVDAEMDLPEDITLRLGLSTDGYVKPTYSSDRFETKTSATTRK